VSQVSSRGAIWLPLAVQAASRQRCRSSISLPTATVGHTVLSSTQIRHAAITAMRIMLQPVYRGPFIGMTHQVQIVPPSGRLTAWHGRRLNTASNISTAMGIAMFQDPAHYRRRGRM
jgi:hypothetical protein